MKIFIYLLIFYSLSFSINLSKMKVLLEEEKEVLSALEVTSLLKSNNIIKKEKALSILNDPKHKNNKEIVFLKAELTYNGSYGIDLNKKLSFTYYKHSAELNHPEALYNMGLFYYHGVFVTQDIEKSISFFQRSKDLGFPASSKILEVITYSNNF